MEVQASVESHIDEELVEQYALGGMTELESASVEEHLLVCRRCQDALSLTDRLIHSIRAALKE